MSEPDLRDLRAKISAETDIVLEAESRVSGQDRSEIVRDVLHTWAVERIRKSRLITESLLREGMEAPLDGGRGKGRA